MLNGLLILRPEGRIFFANAQIVGDQIRDLVGRYQPEILTLDMSRVPDIEYTALHMLVAGERKMRAAGVTTWLAALNPDVRACIRASPLQDRLGSERMVFNARAAVRKFEGLHGLGGDSRPADTSDSGAGIGDDGEDPQ
jgi:MFS superfamily sulfate permease-like transporter